MLTAKSQTLSPSSVRRVDWPLLAAAFALLAFLLMVWRWGGTVADSQAYFDTARYLRGEIPASELVAPFPYRLLVPAVASVIPGELRNGFAMLNWVLVTAGACLMSAAALRAGLSERRAIGAGLLMIVSLPVAWYAPYLLVDPGSVCARAAFVLALLCGQPWLAALAGLVGTAVREENILLLVWLVAMRRIGILPGLAFLAAAGAWIVSVRWFTITGLPGYTWAPSWWTVRHALGDVRSLLSIAGSACIIVPLAVLGWRSAPPALRPFATLLALMALPPLYAALCVRVDGRAVWGLYPFLVPFAACARLRLTPAR
ncbi:hypothetical protein [Massilia yuzhufengensis]|uniref:DUF2029 domain-containing protein n=1 Tax=Massilia yuzhufengensis TaxID=1164594 RepID=A0A1I1HF94_9BURK|nr:hypothetical protein [Massilia yuzhufengensis]SFC22829.1 hypothetical protein SAMN05216204_104241 [Massilia yuzhufengensis]